MSDSVRVDGQRLSDLIAKMFVEAGCSHDEGKRIGDNLVEATQSGHDSHGVVRVPRYLDWLEAGIMKAGQSVTVLQDNDSWLHLDGNFGFGQTVGPEAMRLGIQRAHENGLCLVSLKNAGHLGRIGAFGEQTVRAGLASIHFVNVSGSTLVAPFGASERRISTAPVCVALPNDDAEPFVLDFATSNIAEGKALSALRGGKPVPPNALVGPDGALSNDPVLLYGDSASGSNPDPQAGPGALTAMGDHKGSGLALACELLAGALTGSGTSGPKGRRAHNGMLSIILDPQRVGEGDGWTVIAQRFLDWIKEARPRDPHKPVMLPGEPERLARDERGRLGLPLPPLTLDGILKAGEAIGLNRAEMEAFLDG